jgi:predicted DNA-binding transcriptional regulator YafY
MKRITQVDRVLTILKILNKGQEVCLRELPSGDIPLLKEIQSEIVAFLKLTEKEEHDVWELIKSKKEVSENDEKKEKENLPPSLKIGLRSLQKDMRYIKKYLGDNLTKNGSHYKLVKKEYLDDFFKDNHEEIRKFFHAISLIDQSVFGKNFKKYQPLLNSIKAQQKDVYLFLENPFENLKKLDLKDELEQYIQQRRYIDIDYYADKLYEFKRVQPYKIIYQNGNWYLAVLTTQDYEINGGFKLLRLNFIKKITKEQFSPTNFHEDKKVKDFLENKFQSLFTSFDREFFRVKVRISKEVARYFKVKKHLKSQNIVGKIDGDLLVEFTINDDMEIIPMVQIWMPHIRIIEPERLNERVLENIIKYTNNLV